MNPDVKPLQLAKLPDRNPVGRTVVCDPALNTALEEYALLYRETYAEAESVETLIPFMLAAFLAKDRAFAGFRKARAMHMGSEQSHDWVNVRHRRRRKHGVEAGSTAFPA